MNPNDVYACAPGSRLLLFCSLPLQESMVESICLAMPPLLRQKTALNTSPITTMDIAPDSSPNHFSDLVSLCARLIAAAGRRSHYEGLLLLNIDALLHPAQDTLRLKALGELLAMPDGLASACITVLYGPDKESEALACADALDFDGRLRIICYDQPLAPSLQELLERASLRCDTSETEHMLESVLEEMANCERFNAGRFVKTCGNGLGLITENSVRQTLVDPYSYINRIRRGIGKPDSNTRRIGFHVER